MGTSKFESNVTVAEANLAAVIEKSDHEVAKNKFKSIPITDPTLERDLYWNRSQLQKAVKALEEFNQLPADKQIASELHERLCRWEHTEGCSWYYEDKDNRWEQYAHAKYLAQAHTILEDATPEETMRVITNL